MVEKIALASDHRGYEWKQQIGRLLKEKGYGIEDCGTSSEGSCDYTDFIFPAAEKVAAGECHRAIGICYTGIGSTIAANKVKGVRAALCQSIREAELSRGHNDANMLILGAGVLNKEILEELIDKWLNTAFEGGRHEQRVNKIRDYEQRQQIPSS